MDVPEAQLFAASTTVSCHGGALSVVKRRIPLVCGGSPELEREARRRAELATIHEARWLAAARHRSVVPLRRVIPSEYLVETAYAGRHSLQTAMLTPEQAMRSLGSVATALHELHEQGIVHGQLTPDHVIVGRTRPRQVSKRVSHQVSLCSPRTHGGATPDDDLDALIALADQLRVRLAPRSIVWAATLAGLRSNDHGGDAEVLVRAFAGLDRSRFSPAIWIRSPAPST